MVASDNTIRNGKFQVKKIGPLKGRLNPDPQIDKPVFKYTNLLFVVVAVLAVCGPSAP